MRKFSKICQKVTTVTWDVKNRVEKKVRSSKLVSELLKLELKNI